MFIDFKFFYWVRVEWAMSKMFVSAVLTRESESRIRKNPGNSINGLIISKLVTKICECKNLQVFRRSAGVRKQMCGNFQIFMIFSVFLNNMLCILSSSLKPTQLNMKMKKTNFLQFLHFSTNKFLHSWNSHSLRSTLK